MINFTDSALEHFRRQVGDSKYLSVSLEKYGCSGYAYNCVVVDTVPDNFVADEVGGLRIAYPIDRESLLRGLLVDYRKHGLNYRVSYLNPNEVARCGCGESFYFG